MLMFELHVSSEWDEDAAGRRFFFFFTLCLAACRPTTCCWVTEGHSGKTFYSLLQTDLINLCASVCICVRVCVCVVILIQPEPSLSTCQLEYTRV